MKVLCKAFLWLSFGKKALSYEKRARKMLMKLTPAYKFNFQVFCY